MPGPDETKLYFHEQRGGDANLRGGQVRYEVQLEYMILYVRSMKQEVLKCTPYMQAGFKWGALAGSRKPVYFGLANPLSAISIAFLESPS